MFRLFLFLFVFINSLLAYPSDSECFKYTAGHSIVSFYTSGSVSHLVNQSDIGAPNKLLCSPYGDLFGYQDNECYADGARYDEPNDGLRFCTTQRYYKVVSQCPAGQVAVNNQCLNFPSCPSGQIFQPHINACAKNPCPKYWLKGTHPDFSGNCVASTDEYLTSFKDDFFKCQSHGGFPSSSLSSGGTSILKGNLKFKMAPSCLSYNSYLNEQMNLALSIGPGSWNGLKKIPFDTWEALKRDWKDLSGVPKTLMDLAKSKWDALFKSGDNPVAYDTLLKLPKATTTGPAVPQVGLLPVPHTLDGVPAHVGRLDADPYLSLLKSEYFDPNVETSLSHAKLDTWNQDNRLYKDNNQNPTSYTLKDSNLYDNTHRSSSSEDSFYDTPIMYESTPPKLDVDLNPMYRFSPSSQSTPQTSTKLYDVPVTTTVTTKTVNDDYIQVWENTRHYQDGSSSIETIEFSPRYKQGSRSITTLDSSGSNTVGHTFSAPNYKPSFANSPEAWSIVKTSPVVKTHPSIKLDGQGVTHSAPTSFNGYPDSVIDIDPVTGEPINPISAPNVAPVTDSGKDLLNAQMPSYAFASIADFIAREVEQFFTVSDEYRTFYGNLKNNLVTIEDTFTSTKQLISGDFHSFRVPVGNCSGSMSFEFHGSHIDFCPPLTEFTSKIYPLIVILISIVGMILSVRIYIKGFNV